MARFADVLTIINGRNQKKVENPKGKYPIYGSGGIMGYADDYLCEAETVVIGRKGSINKPIYVEMPFWNVDTAFGLSADREKLEPKYLYYFCENYDFERLNTTVTIPSLTKANLLDIEIPLPPLNKQKKIASVLDRTADLISLRMRQLAKLDELVKARFVEMFSGADSERNTVPMTSICDIIDGDRGKNYPKQDEFSDKGFCLFLNAKNVTGSGFSFEKCLFISKEKDELLHSGKLKRGDIVLTTRGTIGNLAYYTDKIQFKNVRINSGMVILRMKKGQMNEIFFIEQFKLKLDNIKDKIASGSAQPQLPISAMNKITMIVPQITMQNQFAAFAEQVNKPKSAIEHGLKKLETLKKALMQEYFG